jgi:hypothetical protein
MARPHPSHPDPDGFWPSCDEEQPGVSIRPLNHADLQALLAHLHHHAQPYDEIQNHLAGSPPAPAGPVVAVRVRASVGRPGASAQAEYRRRRATERASWTRGLPWRVAVVVAAGVAAGLLAAQVIPDLASLLTVVAAAGLAWLLRFRVSADTLAWRRGRRAPDRPPACLPGAPRLGRAARPGHPRLGGQHRSPRDRPWRRAGHRLQAVPGTAAAGLLLDALARPPHARLDPAQDPVGGRPDRRDPWHRRPPDPGHRGRAWCQRPLGPGSCRRRDGRSGPAGS